MIMNRSVCPCATIRLDTILHLNSPDIMLMLVIITMIIKVFLIRKRRTSALLNSLFNVSLDLLIYSLYVCFTCHIVFNNIPFQEIYWVSCFSHFLHFLSGSIG